ncbi:unnamed protein product, partial [Symbiodinium necroappetens]
GGALNLTFGAVRCVKGWTRASCVAWILCCLVEVALDMSEIKQNFRNMALSFRGMERQPPTILQMALRFSRVMELQATTVTGSTEARLEAAIEQFNKGSDLNVKHSLDDDKKRSILNILTGTTKETRDIMAIHLNFYKWRESALSTEQMKSSRWLLGATRKNTAEAVKPHLVVKARGQEMLMALHIRQFEKGGRRLKASARTKLRLSPPDFEKLVDYATLMDSVREASKLLKSDPEID